MDTLSRRQYVSSPVYKNIDDFENWIDMSLKRVIFALSLIFVPLNQTIFSVDISFLLLKTSEKFKVRKLDRTPSGLTPALRFFICRRTSKLIT